MSKQEILLRYRWSRWNRKIETVECRLTNHSLMIRYPGQEGWTREHKSRISSLFKTPEECFVAAVAAYRHHVEVHCDQLKTAEENLRVALDAQTAHEMGGCLEAYVDGIEDTNA